MKARFRAPDTKLFGEFSGGNQLGRARDEIANARQGVEMVINVDRDEQLLENELLPLVYDELHRLAQAKMARESPGHTLQPTALVHEAYLRLVQAKHTGWKSRATFFAAAAEAMRRILIERARRYETVKRGAGRNRVPLEEADVAESRQDVDVEALSEALDTLEENDPRAAKIVKLRYFAGLSVDETAELMGVSRGTVQNDWTMGKAWLRDRLRERAEPPVTDTSAMEPPAAPRSG